MKNFRLVAILSVLALANFLPAPIFGASEDGVALEVVYDTSGSMKDQVRDANGKMTAKYLIANRALQAIAARLQNYTTNTSNGPRPVQAGLTVFKEAGAKDAIPFGPFNAQAFDDWARQFSKPDGGTPLGAALKAAGQTVLKSPLNKKHVLVITDGVNTMGPPPATTFGELRKDAGNQETALSVHFIAFDVDAQVFAGVKKLGATVVGAANETQLNQQLEFILAKKILLEEEEPAKAK